MTLGTAGLLGPSGEMGTLIRSHDWAASSIGPMPDWPSSLRTLIDVMLDAKQPMHVAWGPERTLIYNDAYAVLLGRKHPDALGRPCLDVWSEARNDLAPLFDRVFAGGSVHMDDISLIVERHGQPEEAHFAFSYTPVRDGMGKVEGLFTSCTDTTAQVKAERHRVAESDRMRDLFVQAPGFIAVLRGPGHTFEMTNDAYLRLIGGRDVIGMPVREALGELEGQVFLDLLDRVYATGEAFVGQEAEIWVERTPGHPASGDSSTSSINPSSIATGR